MLARAKALPLEKVDQIILKSVEDKILQSDHLQTLMAELRKHIQSGKDSRQKRVADQERRGTPAPTAGCD